MEPDVVTLDVREALDRGQEPFSLIMQTVGKLSAGEQLLLIVPFEPVPLYQVMAQRGYAYESTAREDGNWNILFSPSGATAVEKEAAEPPSCDRRAWNEF